MYPGGMPPPGLCLFGRLPAETKCRLPASTAARIPRHLSGVLPKSLETWNYPSGCLLPQKKMLAGIIHLYFCNNIFAEKHIVGSSEPAIIFSNVRMDCSTKTSDFKQKEAALTFTLSSS